MLRQYGLTPTAFAALPEGEQAFVLGYERYRRRRLSEIRAQFGDPDPKKSRLSPEMAMTIDLQRL